MVSILQDRRAVPVIPDLTVLASTEDAHVIPDGAGEDPGGGLHQIPDPGLLGARVGDQSPHLEAVSHHEPSPELPALRVSRPEVICGSSSVPLQGLWGVGGLDVADNGLNIEQSSVVAAVLH